jgi:hypothetical protein
MRELNDLEESRLDRLLQLPTPAFEKLLAFAEREHNPDSLINHADLQRRIGGEIKKQSMGQQIRWQYFMGGFPVQKLLGGNVEQVVVPVVQLFLGLRSPIIGKSEADNHNWFNIMLECNPTNSDIERSIKVGLDKLRQLNTTQLNGGAISGNPGAAM